MKVTRIAYSARLNPGKYAALVELARRLGRVRSEVWQRYGSILGVGSGLRDRQVRDRWLADGTHVRFGVLANAWKETVRDAMADIGANMEAAKVDVRRAISRRTNDPAERKPMFTALKADRWAGDPFLARQMRKHWKRGRNRTHDQIVVRADKYNTAVDGQGLASDPGRRTRGLLGGPRRPRRHRVGRAGLAAVVSHVVSVTAGGSAAGP
ncbi:hypothetical protein ABZ783_12900 [Micromonospora sp. NPDC047738]|uniref:hypothetical protein n=1 Tax=Micromonospora sp. NPDC047738 TaxID=3155741 RepID=UPI0033E97DB3